MNLKGLGRSDDALRAFAAVEEDAHGHLAIAEIEMERGNATGVLVHLIKGLLGGALHDRHWKLLVEVLGVFGLWRDAESVLERCVLEGCSFAGLDAVVVPQGTWCVRIRLILPELSRSDGTTGGAAESGALQATLMRYHQQGRNAPEFVSRVQDLQTRWWRFPLTVEAGRLLERSDFLDELRLVRTQPPWDRYVYFHLGKCIYPISKKLLTDVRTDHAAMVALHNDIEDPSNDRLLIATTSHLGTFR